MLPARSLVGLGFLMARLMARAPLRRRQWTLAERLAALPARGLPVREPVSIRWNDHQVPFIEARHDRDCAVALGVVHAHLRLAQLEVMRRVAQGRIAEALGPAAIELDHTLRILDFGRAIPGMIEMLPADTRAWLEGFADGINHVVDHVEAHRRLRPREMTWLGLRPQRWTVRDLLTIGRLAGSDFTWRVWIPLLRLRGRSDWARLWGDMMTDHAMPVPSFTGGGGQGLGMLDRVLAGLGRTGSNSFAVSGTHTSSGAALLASDPHLGVVLPNLWLAAGYRSPTYQCVGLMIPGIPVMALGRNPHIGWGGTSLHAASSELFDVDDLPDCEITERRERIRVRWWPDREIVVRETAYGPIVSDAPLLRRGVPRGGRIALHWVGHLPSDEITALLAVNRARDWDAFHAALDGLSVPAQNMIYADTAGRVGQAMAARLPRRPAIPPPDMILPREARRHWRRFVTARDLPTRLEPERGFVASANNRPELATAVPVGFFFSSDERVARIRAVLSESRPTGLDIAMALQHDVLVPSAPALRDRLLRLADAAAADELLRIVRRWDGRYTAESEGAAAFELLLNRFAEALHGPEDLAIYSASWEPWALLFRDLDTLPGDRLRTAMKAALAPSVEAFARTRRWGEMHRLRLSHLLSAVPVAGRRFRFTELPWSGSNETVMKAAHGFASGRHAVRFGATARHVSDFSDPDANYVALLGGQDGWIGSSTFMDQLALWQRHEYVRIPLRAETARQLFRHETTLTP
jgi:penicillin G amidase